MVFIQGSYDIPTTIGLISQALAATDDFEMVDEAATVSDTDKVLGTGICIKHTPTNQYIAFYVGHGQTNTGGNTCGILVRFSTAWDIATHLPDGTIYKGIIPIYTNNSSDKTRLVSPYVFSTSMWIDKYGVVGTIQNTYNSDGQLFTLEFFPTLWVEYDDGHHPIVLMTKNVNHNYSGEVTVDLTGNSGAAFTYVRPYRFRHFTSPDGDYGVFRERQAYRSEGNNKVYFKFPTYENGLPAARTAFAETRRWFRVSVTGGIQIGDILNWIDPDEVTVHKYIVCVAKGDQMFYAIPYENAFDYAVSAKQ